MTFSIFASLYFAAKGEVMCIFKTAHAENKERGYDGPFCSLQMGLTTAVAKVEYATAWANLIRFVGISVFILFGVASRSLQR